MPSAYLQSADYAAYGLPAGTTSAQITQASSIIDGYLQRYEGLIWAPDANGNPAYMVAKTPDLTLTGTQSISPGANVNVTVTGPALAIQSGQVLILDRANTMLTEACIVNTVTTVGSVTTVQLRKVQFSHSTNCTMDAGMVIFEECNMPSARPVTTLSRTPIRIILSGQGRYGYTRRGNSNFAIDEFNLLAAVTQFGGPPIWEIFDQSLVGVDPNTGMVWAPSGVLLAYYTEIRFSYIAGWSYASLPSQIKQACANIVLANTSFPANGAIQSMRAGDTAITRFAATYIDEDTKSLLNPFMTKGFV